MNYNNKIFRICKNNNWFSYYSYNSRTGGYGYVQNSGSSDCLKALRLSKYNFSTSGSRVQNQRLYIKLK